MVNICEEGLTKECFDAYPQYARQLLSFRLLNIFFPAQVRINLPRVLQVFTPLVQLTLPPGFDPALSIVQPPTVDPGVEITGPVPPTFIAPGEPGPANPPSAAPSATQVEAPIESETSDGWIRNQGAPGTWAGYRDALSGTLADNNDTRHTDAIQGAYYSGWYFIYRSFYYFDLSSIPAAATVLSVALDLTGYVNDAAVVAVQQGTQQDTLDTTDFDAFTGAIFGTTSWTTVPPALNTINFNSAGIAFIQSLVAVSGVAKLCAREYDHDVMNVDPAPGPTGTVSGAYYSNWSEASKRPTLRVTYEA